MVVVAVAVAMFVVACGAAAAPSASAPSASTECTDALTALRAELEASRARACASDAECRTITSPRHPDHEYDEVVHAADADALAARSAEHLARCGASVHHETIDAYREVRARCVELHCAAEETIVHVEE